jgi:ArsR family transcriptional regulator
MTLSEASEKSVATTTLPNIAATPSTLSRYALSRLRGDCANCDKGLLLGTSRRFSLVCYRISTMNDMTEPDCCPPSREALPVPTDPAQIDDEVALVAKALSHPARVQILRILLARSTCTCGEIVEALPLAQATVSQHLKVLKEAGLIRGEVDGARVCYCADPHVLHRFNNMLSALDQARVHSEMEVAR